MLYKEHLGIVSKKYFFSQSAIPYFFLSVLCIKVNELINEAAKSEIKQVRKIMHHAVG